MNTGSIPNGTQTAGGVHTAGSRMIEYREPDERVDYTFITGTNTGNKKGHTRRVGTTSNFPNIHKYGGSAV